MHNSDLITPQHLTRKAVIYIWQSTPHQVVSHQESLRLQYALGERALENLQRDRKTAKQISRRHQIGQEIDFRWLFVHQSGRRAMTVDPPET